MYGTALAESLEEIPATKRRKETVTEDTPMETVGLSMCVQYLRVSGVCSDGEM